MRALSSGFFITLRERDLQNISLSDELNPRLFRNTLTANDKYPVRDGENLTFPIQMNYL